MKSSLHTAVARCNACKELIISPGGGRFRNCSCGESFVDQERWAAMHIRTSNCELLEQICPCDCKSKDKETTYVNHEDNRQFCEFEDLKDYMKKTYGMRWNEKQFNWIKDKRLSRITSSLVA